MSDKSEKQSSFLTFILTTLFFLILSYAGGVGLNYLMSSTVNFSSRTTLTYAFVIFLVVFLFYVISYTSKDKEGRLKGKSSMENQHFASLKELNKNYKHCFYTDLKNLSVTGIPFRFERKHNNIHIHFTPPCHVLIVGASGTGKTACWVEPTMQILSELKNRPSLFITDPKGEIYAHHSLNTTLCKQTMEPTWQYLWSVAKASSHGRGNFKTHKWPY